MEIDSDINTKNQLQRNNQLKQLEKEHKQLEQSLQQRKHSLFLHAKMVSQIQTQDSTLCQQNEQLIQQLFKKQEAIQLSFANMLINGQIRIEQEIEYRDLLKQYQLRISELRTTMIDKEVELVSQMSTKKKQFAPTKEHLRNFHLAQVEENNLKQLMKQHDTLKMEVQRMEQELRIKSQRTRDCTEQMQQDQNPSKNIKQGYSSSRGHQQSFIYRDRLLFRVYSLLEEQAKAQQQLRQQYQKLKKQYKQASQNHAKLAKTYKQSHAQYTQKILELSQPYIPIVDANDPENFVCFKKAKKQQDNVLPQLASRDLNAQQQSFTKQSRSKSKRAINKN